MEITTLVQVWRGVHHLQDRPRNKIPIIGQCKWEHGLKLQIDNIPLGPVQPVGVFLELERPDARNRVRQFFINFVEGLAVGRLRSGTPDI
jgi:hypothetical protein